MCCPPSREPRLVIDIGGGSTEFIIGREMTPERLESLKLGCVSMSQRFFPRGELRADAFLAAETHARAEIEAIAREFGPEHWQRGVRLLGHGARPGRDPRGERAVRGRHHARRACAPAQADDRRRQHSRLQLAGVKPERAPVLAGGFAIMAAAIAELRVPRINPVGGALRLGVLYDLLGRTVEARQPRRDGGEPLRALAHRPPARPARRGNGQGAVSQMASPAPDPEAAQRVEWAALLHEIGYSVSHIGFHKHGAYILENADMPGFSAQEQRQLALLVLGCRGGLSKMADAVADHDLAAQVLALRLAVLFHHARRAIDTPRIALKVGRSIKFAVAKRWLKAHPLTTHLLDVEREEWSAVDRPWRALR